METLHIPVMPKEVLELLAVRSDGLYLDGTAGLGGHSELLLKAGCRVICLDRDALALERCRERVGCFGEQVSFVHGNFRDFLVGEPQCQTQSAQLNCTSAHSSFDGILLDLGVSSMQLDMPERGFSYRHEAPLDMRMDRGQTLTAAEVVNGWDYRRLVRLLYDYGEERYAPKLAQGITAARPLETTTQLTEVILESMPAKGRREAQHPARRTFQAIRIAVNGELDAIEEALPAAVKCLRPGGRLGVISFHSLEDRLVKRAFAEAAKGCTCPPSFPACACGKTPNVKLLGRFKPEAEEVEANPRSASAVLRVLEKL
jgi:16S rRNA (cytosine1402-N4)-methyltransferase